MGASPERFLGECGYGVRRRRSGQIDVLLDGARHAVKRSESFAGSNSGIGSVGGGECLGVESTNDGIQSRIDVVDSCEMCFDDFAARHFARGHEARQLASTVLPELIGHGSPLSHHAFSGDDVPGQSTLVS